VKVSEFSGKSLSAGRSTRWDVDPDIPRTHELQTWAETQNFSNVQSLTKTFAGSSASVPWKTLKAATDEATGQEKASFFNVQATILIINHADNAPLFYTACPAEGCNKKVIQDEQTNMWTCLKCQKNYPNSNARYILSVRIADTTLAQWATAFNDIGTQLLGEEANKIKALRDRTDPELEFIFDKASFRRYNFKIKAQEEIYQDEPKIKFTIQSFEPIDYAQESSNLLQKIAMLTQ